MANVNLNDVPEPFRPVVQAVVSFSETVRLIGFYLRCSAEIRDNEDLLKVTLVPYVETAIEALEAAMSDDQMTPEEVVVISEKLAVCRKSLVMWPDCLGRAAAEGQIEAPLLKNAKAVYLAWQALSKILPKGEDEGPADVNNKEAFQIMFLKQEVMDKAIRSLLHDKIRPKEYHRWKVAEGRWRRWQAEGYDRVAAANLAVQYALGREEVIDTSTRWIKNLPTAEGHDS